MKRTLISHFYNEEWLLPWFLNHHKTVFDHGIMIDYHSTDRSVEIIKEICPKWEIHKSKNTYFGWAEVDSEVCDYEKNIQGWRIALNVTEFLIGNYERLSETKSNTNIYLDQFVFVDMNNNQEPKTLDHNIPLYEQRKWGYGTASNNQLKTGTTPRSMRSIHNYAFKYPIGGRHIWKGSPSHEDLAIFYYGWASQQEEALERKLQIQTKIPLSDRKKKHGPGSHHLITKEQVINDIKSQHQAIATDLKTFVYRLVSKHERTRRK